MINFRKFSLIVALWALWALPFWAGAATLHVSPLGLDANFGTESSPLRSVQAAADLAVAGDTVLVAAGNYLEYVRTGTDGRSGAPITFRAAGKVTLRSLRVTHPYHVFEGFTLTGAQNLWGAHVRIEATAHHTELRNCTIGPGVFVLAEDFLFDAETDTVSSPSVDFKAAGFVPGGYVFFGGSSFEPYWYKNHNTGWVIESVSSNSLKVTGDLAVETNNAAWAPIHAGRARDGIPGVDFIPFGGLAASNCIVANCVFTNLFGPAIALNGDNHTVARNTFTKLNSFHGLQPHGGGHLIVSNFWYDCTNIIHYSNHELGSIPHPAGPDWYDYQVGFLHDSPLEGTSGNSNVFAHNWIENVHNQLGQISEGPDHHGFLFSSNVFVGVQANFSGGRDGLSFKNNTFYRVAYDEAKSRALTVGGNSPNTPARNITITRNAFVDIGDHARTNSEGHYSVVNAVNSTFDFNFAANAETIGYQGYVPFSEENGINGGDPMFVNPENPRGPDGIPFTADDGLRPLPNSPIARLSAGALPPIVAVPSVPIAHFRVLAPHGWQDKTGRSYDPEWYDAAPFRRPNRLRPWDTPEALGTGPCEVEFTAEGAISNTSSADSWNGIEQFSWDFGDGGTLETSGPEARHTFQSAGTYTVTLTVKNSAGNSDFTRRIYRVLGLDGVPTPTPPQGLRIAQ